MNLCFFCNSESHMLLLQLKWYHLMFWQQRYQNNKTISIFIQKEKHNSLLVHLYIKVLSDSSFLNILVFENVLQ